jgi:ParE toxin of type II toxin-antitoxin system, parDE
MLDFVVTYWVWLIPALIVGGAAGYLSTIRTQVVAARRAAEARSAEDARRAAEAKAVEDARRAAEAKAADDARRAVEAKAVVAMNRGRALAALAIRYGVPSPSFKAVEDARRAAAGMRSMPVRPHVVFYQISKRTIEVVRVLHQRMDVEHVFTS